MRIENYIDKMMKKIEIAILCLFSFFLLQMLDVQAQTPLKKAVAGQTFQVPCERIDSLVSLARTKNGCHYKHAGSGPNVFDCSGFTMWCYSMAGISLPHSAASQAGYVTPKSQDQLQPGDLIVYSWGKFKQPNNAGASHIGIVASVSNGRITAIEGNKGISSVSTREIPVGWGFIRGYARPRYVR